MKYVYVATMHNSGQCKRLPIPLVDVDSSSTRWRAETSKEMRRVSIAITMPRRKTAFEDAILC